MNDQERIAKAIKRGGAQRPTDGRWCVVDTVDTAAGTCDVTPQDDGPQLLDVLIRARTTTANEGLLLIPAVGSVVVVASMQGSGNAYYIALYSEIEEVILILKNGKAIHLMPDGKIKLGALDGQLEPAVLGNKWKTLMQKLLSACKAQTYTNGAGTTSPPNNVSQFIQLESELQQCLSLVNEIE
jgi:hypothetical protein